MTARLCSQKAHRSRLRKVTRGQQDCDTPFWPGRNSLEGLRNSAGKLPFKTTHTGDVGAKDAENRDGAGTKWGRGSERQISEICNIFCHLAASEEGVAGAKKLQYLSQSILTPRNTEKLISLKSKTQNAVEEDHDHPNLSHCKGRTQCCPTDNESKAETCAAQCRRKCNLIFQIEAKGAKQMIDAIIACLGTFRQQGLGFVFTAVAQFQSLVRKLRSYIAQ